MKIKESNQVRSKKQSKCKICPYCGQSSQTVFVHGHEQCVVCKTNIEPCCSGQELEVGGMSSVVGGSEWEFFQWNKELKNERLPKG